MKNGNRLIFIQTLKTVNIVIYSRAVLFFKGYLFTTPSVIGFINFPSCQSDGAAIKHISILRTLIIASWNRCPAICFWTWNSIGPIVIGNSQSKFTTSIKRQKKLAVLYIISVKINRKS